MQRPNNVNIRRARQPWNDRFFDLYPEERDRGSHVMSISFIVTESCNLNCTYCYQGHKSAKSMSIEVAERAIDFILQDNEYVEVDKTPAVVLDFIGGEPLLEVDLIAHAISYFNRRTLELNHHWFNRYVAGICTNGLLYLDPKVQKLIDMYRSHIGVNISIDGDRETHDACRIDHAGNGSYDRILPAVKHLIAMQYDSSTKVTFAHDNLPLISRAIKHLLDLGFVDIHANVVFEDVWKPGDNKILYDQLIELADIMIDGEYYTKHSCSLFEDSIGHPLDDSNNNNWCGGSGAMLAIGPDGTLYPCIRFAPYSLGPDVEPIVLGNIYDGYTNLDSGIVCELCSITRRSQSNDECYYCPVGSGCAWCFRAGTRILTPSGLRNIETLDAGDEVISSDGTTQIVDHVSCRVADDTIGIKAAGTPTIYTTLEHPFWARKKHEAGPHITYDDPKWTAAGELSIGDRIALYVPTPGAAPMNKNVAYIVGRWLGDGWRVDRNPTYRNPYVRYKVCCSAEEADQLEQKMQAADIGYHRDKTQRTAQEFDIYTVNKYGKRYNANNELLVSIISRCGKYSHSKCIPPDIFTWNKESIIALLTGYLDADGNRDGNRVRFTTVSKDLAFGISMLLRITGNNPSWTRPRENSSNICGREVATLPAYELHYRPYKAMRRHYWHYDTDNSIIWAHVTGIDTEVGSYTVYNMSVSGNHTYIADGAIVHNCSGLNHQIFGTPDHRATYICKMHKARVLANLYYWNKLYAKLGMDERLPCYLTEDEINELDPRGEQAAFYSN
jgi:uncharacterized protein